MYLHDEKLLVLLQVTFSTENLPLHKLPNDMSVCPLPTQVIHITGRLRIRMALTHSRSVPNQIMGMVVVAHALPPPTINEVRIDCQMFVTRVNMDLKIVYCENR